MTANREIFKGSTWRYRVSVWENRKRALWIDDGENAHQMTPDEARQLAQLLMTAADMLEPTDAPMLGGDRREKVVQTYNSER